jgi:hypothetical protein
MLVGTEPRRITQEVEQFLREKGVCIQDEKHTYICLYGFKENPFYYLCFYAIYILWQRFFTCIKPGALHLTTKEKDNSLNFLFNLGTQGLLI